MEKEYKKYQSVSLGGSDIATLIAVGCGEEGVKVYPIDLGGDGSYHAYVVDEACEVPDYYEEVFNCESWIKIYDDASLVYTESSSKIHIYRAGGYGMIIQLL